MMGLVQLASLLGSTMLPNAVDVATTFINGNLDRRNAVEIARMDHDFQRQVEENRQDFEIDKLKVSFQMQTELLQKKHQLALQEQNLNFEKQCETEEWKRFVADWPLQTLPMVLRKSAVLSSGMICFQVFFTHSKDEQFEKYIYPYIEQGLKEFADLYPNKFAMPNLQFYQKCFKGECNGSVIYENMHFALGEFPTLIIDTNVVGNTVHLSFCVWGIGFGEKRQMTLHDISFDRRMFDRPEWEKEVRDLAELLLAYLKIIIGYTYDLYNLMNNASAPVFPEIMRYEYEQCGDPVFSTAELGKMIGPKYMYIYDRVLKNAELLSFRGAPVHLLKLNFAGKLENYITLEQLLDCVYDALASWVKLRSVKSPEKFLEMLKDRPALVRRYFSDEDKSFFWELERLFRDSIYTNHFVSVRRLLASVSEILQGKQAAPEAREPVIWREEKRRAGDGSVYRAELSSQAEIRKYDLIEKIGKMINNNEFDAARQPLRELISIYREQGCEREAYHLEHTAFLCEQKKICMDAEIPLAVFNEIPYVDVLKEALTDAAEAALEKEQTDAMVFYKLMNARICRAQGRESDAYLLECTAYSYREKAREIRSRRNMSNSELEAQYMKALVETYCKTRKRV